MAPLIDHCKSLPDVGCFLLGTIATLSELSRRRDELPRSELSKDELFEGELLEGELFEGELPKDELSEGLLSNIMLTSLFFTEASLDGFSFLEFAQRC